MCRFYGFNLEEVMQMTLRQFTIMYMQIQVIMQMEQGGGTQKGSLTGEAAIRQMKRHFKKAK